MMGSVWMQSFAPAILDSAAVYKQRRTERPCQPITHARLSATTWTELADKAKIASARIGDPTLKHKFRVQVTCSWKERMTEGGDHVERSSRQVWRLPKIPSPRLNHARKSSRPRRYLCCRSCRRCRRCIAFAQQAAATPQPRTNGRGRSYACSRWYCSSRRFESCSVARKGGFDSIGKNGTGRGTGDGLAGCNRGLQVWVSR